MYSLYYVLYVYVIMYVCMYIYIYILSLYNTTQNSDLFHISDSPSYLPAAPASLVSMTARGISGTRGPAACLPGHPVGSWPDPVDPMKHWLGLASNMRTTESFEQAKWNGDLKWEKTNLDEMRLSCFVSNWVDPNWWSLRKERFHCGKPFSGQSYISHLCMGESWTPWKWG